MLMCRVKYEGVISPSFTKTESNGVLKRAWEAVGLYWHRRFRLKHFTPSGAQEYGYEKRSGDGATFRSRQISYGKGKTKGAWNTYVGRKLRTKGHNNPLEWSGRSKAATARKDIRATRKGVRVVLHAPLLNFIHRFSRVSPSKEMRTVSDAEAKVLTEVLKNAIDAGIREVRAGKMSYI